MILMMRGGAGLIPDVIDHLEPYLLDSTVIKTSRYLKRPRCQDELDRNCAAYTTG